MITRFQQEISGELDRQVAERTGEPNKGFWKRHAEEEVAKIVEEYENGELLIDEFGVAYWASNNRAIPQECVEKAIYGGLPIDAELTRELELNQMEKSLAEYHERMKNHVYTEEELGEMRNAFGEGTVVVNALTGERIQL